MNVEELIAALEAVHELAITALSQGADVSPNAILDHTEILDAQ